MNSEKKYSWWPLFFTNFFSTFNDNLIKWLVVFVGAKWVSEEFESTVMTVAGAMLVLPFIFFSPFAGKMAKIYEKKSIMIWGKAAEIPIMLIAILGFYLQNVYIVMVAVLLMGTQSALFSPAKYGLIRDIKGVEGIPFGTGAMEMLTFVGVLLGTVAAGIISDHYSLNHLSIILLGVAFFGWVMSKLIKANESPVLEKKEKALLFFVFLYKQYKISRNYPGVNYSIFGLSMFWLMGAMVQFVIKTHGQDVLLIDDSTIGYTMAIAAIGIAVGALFTGWLSGKKVHLGYVFFGSMGLGISSILIIILKPELYAFQFLIFLVAFFAGFYKIPLNAYIQDKVKGRQLGDTLGYLNISVFIFILLASFFYEIIMRVSDKNTDIVFAFIGLSSAFVGIYFFLKVPGVKDDFMNLLKGKIGRFEKEEN